MRTEREAPYVVVGIDPGWNAEPVVALAAREAARRDVPLAIVAVARRSTQASHSRAGLAADDGWSATVARRALADAYDSVDDPRREVHALTFCLWDDEVHPDQAPLADAALLVVGSRGRHGRVAFSLGSVSRALLKAVDCPVLTVPSGPPPAAAPTGAVVAGLGDHPWDATVLWTAMHEAARRGADLHVVHAYTPTGGETLSAGLARAETHVARATQGLDPGPGTSVSLMLTQDAAARAILHQAVGASLVVIGSRPGALSGLLLDSVSRPVLETSPCPVLVVQRGEPLPHAAVDLPAAEQAAAADAAVDAPEAAR
jgi:nucleotide-binding universal stress UspA family protein